MLEDLAKLLLRLSFGLSLSLAHGLPKLLSFAENSARFADPLGFGPFVSLLLVIAAELFCSLLVAVGLMTRLAVIPVIVVMTTAVFRIHVGQPWDNKEAAALFGVAFICIGLLGAGKFSLDYLVFKKR